MVEIWKDIKGYEDNYIISNCGNIKSKKTNKNVYFSNSKNYKRVLLSKNGKAKGYSVHRLVAQNFIPNPNNYPCVNHLDCDKTNNRVDNLQWCTYKQNNNHKNHNLKRYITNSINIIKKDYPNKVDLLNKLKEIQEEILLL